MLNSWSWEIFGRGTDTLVSELVNVLTSFFRPAGFSSKNASCLFCRWDVFSLFSWKWWTIESKRSSVLKPWSSRLNRPFLKLSGERQGCPMCEVWWVSCEIQHALVPTSIDPPRHHSSTLLPVYKGVHVCLCVFLMTAAEKSDFKEKSREEKTSHFIYLGTEQPPTCI